MTTEITLTFDDDEYRKLKTAAGRLKDERAEALERVGWSKSADGLRSEHEKLADVGKDDDENADVKRAIRAALRDQINL